MWRSCRRLANEIHALGDNKEDIAIATTADEGGGKTSFAFYMAALLHPEANFSMQKATDLKRLVDENMILNPRARSVIEQVNKLPKFSPIIVDEAVKIANKRLWNTREQIALTQFFSTARKQYKFVFMCIPDLFDLDSYFRNRRIRWWVKILGRDRDKGFGVAALFRRKPMTFGHDPWDQDDMQKMADGFYKQASIKDWDKLEQKAYLTRKLPTFDQFLTFPPIPEEVEQYYEEKVESMKDEISDYAAAEDHSSISKAMARVIQEELKKPDTSIRALASQLRLPKSTVHRLSKIKLDDDNQTAMI